MKRIGRIISIICLIMALAFSTSTALAAESGFDRDAATAFVTRLYNNFLGRTPDDAGLESWLSAMKDGRCTGVKLVHGFVFSPEFTSNPMDDEEYVAAMYETILGREPDQGGFDAWVSVLKRGCTRGKILEGFLNSPEMGAICGSMGVEQGKYVSHDLLDRNTNLTFFVSRFYNNALGRGADENGLRGWVAELALNQMDGARLADAFLKSKEFGEKRMTDEEFLEVVNKTMFDRGVTDDDRENLKRWQYRKNYIVEAIVSNEYKELCKDYGVTVQLQPYDYVIMEDWKVEMDSFDEEIPEEHRTLSYGDTEYGYIYRTTYSTDGRAVLDKRAVGEYLGEGTVSVEKTHVLNSVEQLEVEVYSVRDVSTVYSLAVKYDGDDDYYLFQNYYCESDTLGDFAVQAGLKAYGILKGTAKYNLEMKTVSYDTDWLLGKVEEWDQAPTASMPVADGVPSVSFGFTLPGLGIEKYGYAMKVRQDGYLVISVYGGASFYIGEEAAEELISELPEHSEE